MSVLIINFCFFLLYCRCIRYLAQEYAGILYTMFPKFTLSLNLLQSESLRILRFIYSYVYKCPACMHLSTSHAFSAHGGLKCVLNPTELDLLKVESCEVGSGNKTQILNKSNQCSSYSFYP